MPAGAFRPTSRRTSPSSTSRFAGRGALTYGLENGDGGPAAQAALTYPTGLAFRDGNLYIVDTYSRSTIRKVDQAEIITTGGQATAG
ncbi:MAG TPA: hypothetical protein VJS45_19295 [Acidimicrobiia bacterium]|nr:hypothetical protein [Acidimicrobiia bacterium]